MALWLDGSPVVLNVLKNEKVYNSVDRGFASRVDWRATEPLDWSFFKSGTVFCRLANLKTIDGFYHVEYVLLIDRWQLILFEKLCKPSTAFIAYVSKISRQRGLDHAHSNRALERTLCTVDQALVISLCSCFYPIVQFVPLIVGRRLCTPPKKWLFVGHLSSLSSELQVALNPKERSVALAAVAVLVPQGHPWFIKECLVKRNILLHYVSLPFVGAGTVD